MREVWKIIELAAACALFLMAARFCGEAKETAGIVTVFLKGDGLEQEKAEEICREEAGQENPVQASFWGETQEVLATCQETGNSCLVILALMEGNPRLVLPAASSLAWQETGCLVDTATAQELFGTKQADGQILWCGEEPYVVLGTFESGKHTMARAAKAGDGTCLNAVSLDLGGSAAIENDGQQFLMRHGLEGEIIRFDFMLAVTENLLLFLPVFLAVSFLRLLYNRRNGSFSVGKGGRILGTAAAAAFLIWLLKNGLKIPADLLLSRWSDFSFWENWMQSQKQNLLRIFSTPLGDAQMNMVWSMQKSIVCSLGAAFFGMLFSKKS